MNSFRKVWYQRNRLERLTGWRGVSQSLERSLWLMWRLCGMFSIFIFLCPSSGPCSINRDQDGHSKLARWMDTSLNTSPLNQKTCRFLYSYENNFSKLFQVANSVIMLLFIPLFNYIIYPVLAKINLLQTSLQRIGVGFFMAALSFGVSGILDLQLEVNLILKIFSKYILNHFHALAFKWFENILQSHEDGSISILWQLPQYLFMTMAEILFGISTMEFCYSQVEYKKKY